MRLIVLQSDAMIADVVCGREAVYVGTGDQCRIRLDDPRIAAQQAVVHPEQPGVWVVAQLEPACEIRLNDTILTDKAQLKSGDEIRLLDYAIRVYPDYEERTGPRARVVTTRAHLERFAQAKLPATAILKRGEEALNVHPGQLDGLGRAAVAVAGLATVAELMDAVLQFLLITFAAQKVWMGVRRVNYGPMEYEEGRLITGQATDVPPLGKDLRPRVLDRAQFVLIPWVSAEDRTSVLAGPLLGPQGTLGMVYVDSGDSGRQYDMRDLDFLIMLLNVFAYQLDAIFKNIARIRAAMVEGQVSVAHEVQTRLTPRKLPQSDELQFAAFREPGRERSGDIYDIVRLPNNHVAVMMAQAAASGALPSILMTQAQTAFRFACMHQDPPGLFLRSLNWMLYDGEKDHPLHCFAAIIDPGSGEMQYAVAGQVGAFIISNRGEERSLTPTEPQPTLGLTKNTVYPMFPEMLGPGETLVLFTSGVTTAKNRSNETFGEERFINILCDGFGQQASATLKDMLTGLQNFTEGGSQPDDITVILAHRV